MTTNPVPAVVIAAPASGSGKTTVATGLMGALRRAGHTVSAAKVGPDFIDPGYHALATGRPGRNLDPVLVGADLIGPLYRHGSAGADVTVIEGVMGLFDGRITEQPMSPAPGSTAHVAGLLGAPVVLVVDARGQSQSIAALLHGFSTFDRAVRIAGVILNKVGSSRHEEVLRQACEQAGVPVFGAIPRNSGLEIPSRHLGLVTAVEHGRRAHEAVDVMTELVARHVDTEAVARCAGIGTLEPQWAPELESGPAATVALAAGKAFSFGYAEHAELLEMAGAEVVAFDPLTDPLPDGTQALVIPGGFPEQFTAELSANAVVREQIAALAAAGAPVHAECGRRPRRAPHVWRAARLGAVHRAADPGLPRCRGDGRLQHARRGGARHRPRISPHHSRIHRAAATGLGFPGRWAGDRARRGRPRRRARGLPAHPSGRASALGASVRIGGN